MFKPDKERHLSFVQYIQAHHSKGLSTVIVCMATSLIGIFSFLHSYCILEKIIQPENNTSNPNLKMLS